MLFECSLSNNLEFNDRGSIIVTTVDLTPLHTEKQKIKLPINIPAPQPSGWCEPLCRHFSQMNS